MKLCSWQRSDQNQSKDVWIKFRNLPYGSGNRITSILVILQIWTNNVATELFDIDFRKKASGGGGIFIGKKKQTNTSHILSYAQIYVIQLES